MMKEEIRIEYGTEALEFSLQFSDRRTLEIAVLPDTTIRVTAPNDSDVEKIRFKILKRAFWIRQQQRFFQAMMPYCEEREYVSGETHHYLGRKYRLKIREGRESSVRLKGRFFLIELPAKSNRKKIFQLMDGWYRRQGERRFRERLDIYYLLMKTEGIPYPEMEIRQMKTRWGSCKGQKIFLNPDLMKVPLFCVDYVIVHELCHLKIPNHSPAFYRLKEKYMTDWRIRKSMLDKGR